ncbi:MAG: Rad52/Rad22 family DNA repair protein [Thiovulaceae bacterium]|nr:Rad52/Rad22 family DNA repair protein [Sulfurimonadaceae bacterium]
MSYPLDGSRVKTLEKAGRVFSYIPTFDIVNTLNLIFGYDGWETLVKKLEMLNSTTNQNGNHVVTFSAIVRLKIWDTNHKNYIIREDNGISVSIAKTIGEAMETASKASISDALKRTAKSFGNSLGNPLYDPEQKDVDYTNAKQLSENKPAPHSHQNASQNHQQPVPQTQPIHNSASQDYASLFNIGLSVMQKGNKLIVLGDDIFAKKDSIKAYGFRWDAASKQWYKPITEQQAA